MSVPHESYLNYGTIVGNVVKAPGGSPDATPIPTQKNFSPVSAVLELQSTNGALLTTRLTTAQRDSLNATQGMLIYNTSTGFYEVYNSANVWEALTQGASGGVTPFYVIAGPVQMIPNAVYYLNSGAVITLTLPVAANLSDTIEINTMNSNFIIAQNAGQQIRVFSGITTVGVGGNVASNSGNGSSIQIEFNSQIWIASPGFEGTYIIT